MSTWHVILRANEKWKLPCVIASGDVILTSNQKGGWTDGAFLWYCWNGKSYVLGTCGNDNAYQSADPLHSGNHMMLIGGYNTTTPVFFDATNSFTVPGGVSDQECWLQANDGVLNDNSGQIEFDVELCHGWTHSWDFTVSDGGWTGVNSQGCYPTWVSGHGWESCNTSNPPAQYATIEKAILADTTITHVRFTVSGDRNFTNIPAQEFCGVYFFNAAGTLLSYVLHPGNSAPDTHEADTNQGTVRKVGFYIGTQYHTMNGILISLTLSGLGQDPF